jgi:glycerophosphoryl diester phosphodiesterase
LHFHLEKLAEGPGVLQVRDASGFLIVFSFPDFVADTLLVGIALKGPEGSFVSFTQPPVGSQKTRQHQPNADTLHQPSCPDLKIVSHRGAIYAAPENSLLSRNAAVHCDADIIELDVRLTSDGVAVVIHDDFLDRSTNGRGDVTSHTWAELQKLRLRNPDGSVSTEKIPSLEEYVSASGHQGSWLLDKAWPIRAQLTPTLLKMGILPRCVFKGTGSALEAHIFLSSFDETKRPQYLHLIRDSIPALRLDSLMKMKITGFDLQTTDSTHFMLQPGFTRRLRTSDKVLMMSPFVPQFAAGQSEHWYPYPCWKWLTEHGVSWMQTDLPCELLDWREGIRPLLPH